MERNNHFIYLLSIIWKYRKQLITFNAVVVIVTVVYLLLIPNWYRSQVTVLVEKQSDRLNLAATISEMVPFGLGGFGQNDNVLRYIRLLASRTMSDKVIEEFDLLQEYELELRAEVYSALSENTNFIDNEDGSFSIVTSYEEDAQKAADMANYYFDELVKMVEDIDKKQAGSYRNYVEENYMKRKELQKALGTELKRYQEKTGIFELETQIQSTLNTIASLEFEKIKVEIELEIARSEMQEDNPLLNKYEQAVTIHQEKINRIKASNDYTNIPYSSIPQKGLEYYGMYRDFKIEEKLTEYLALQLEQAKLEESKNTSNLYLLDKAVPADKKFKPGRRSKLILVTMLSVLLSIIAVRLKEYYVFKKPEFDSYL